MVHTEPPPQYATLPGGRSSTTPRPDGGETAPLLISINPPQNYRATASATSTGQPPSAGVNPESPGPPAYDILEDLHPDDDLPTYADVADHDPSEEEWLDLWGGWVIFAFFIILVLGTVMLIALPFTLPDIWEDEPNNSSFPLTEMIKRRMPTGS